MTGKIPSSPAASSVALTFRTHGSMREIGEARYNRLLTPDTPPFLSFAWLDALEVSGAVTPERGWAPLHLAAYRNGELVGMAPAYVKGNSEGEFVFDHAWAQFAELNLGIRYYPKLILAVPFTPATGPRVLSLPGCERDPIVSALLSGMMDLVRSRHWSGAHVLFPKREQADELGARGLLLRHGLQFHWHNSNYATFDHFLARFSSKRRNQIRRERRAMQDQNIEIKSFTGQAIGDEQIDQAFEFYLSTVDKFVWGRRYLNRRFFQEVKARMPEQLHLVLAYERGSKKPIAGAFNLLGTRALYGRYWGAREERPFLHFNVCFYHSIEECIERKLELFEPGAGGEHKVARGFEPKLTHSAHYLENPRFAVAIEDFLQRERQAHEQHIEECRREPVLKPL